MVLPVLTFIVVLSILVLVHELGHFFAARRAGVWVEEFGFGLPPRILGKKIGETIYSLNLFPFGGFVRLHGENTEEGVTDPKRAFLNKSKKARSTIILAGVFMNVVLALLCFSIVYSFSGIPRETDNVRVIEIREGSPAAESGLITGDIVREIEGVEVRSNDDLVRVTEENKGRQVNLKVERQGQSGLVELNAVPRENPPENEGRLGVVISRTETYYPPIWQRPFYGVYYGFGESIFWAKLVAAGMFTIFSQLLLGSFPEGVAGPAGLYAITNEVAKLGILPLVNWLGIISLNLAFLNAMPFPALDGGRLLFIGIEKFLGRKVLPKVESWINSIGFALLIIFIIAVTIKEVRLIKDLGLSGYVEYITKTGGNQ